MTSTIRHPPSAIRHRLTLVARDIKLSHSVFALPFALLATFMAAGFAGQLPSAATLALIVVCMVLARTVAMTANRWADAAMDAANPRTAGRAIPSGQLSRPFVLATMLACGTAFIVACAGFWLLNGNPWPVVLAPLVLAYLAGYSYTKRITWLCHLVLGGALALSPVAATIAVEPRWLASPGPWLLFAVVACWVAGFDVIYALQDVAFDRQTGLYSMPASLGVEPGLWISRSLHGLSAAALVTLAVVAAQLGIAFAVAVGITVALLVLEHALVWGSKTHRINIAFFTVNGLISLLLGAAGIADVVRHLY